MASGTDNQNILQDRYAVLKIPGVARGLLVRLFDGLAVQMIAVAVGWQIYELTHDPLLLGFVGLAAGLPFIVAALWAGQMADRKEKSRIICMAETWTFAGVLGLVFLALARKPSILLIYLSMAWISFCRSFQWSALMSYLQEVVPTSIFPKAAAWISGVWQLATIAGPAIGGLIYGRYGPAAAYGVAAACILVALIFAGQLHALPIHTFGERLSEFQDFLSGIRFVFSKQVIVAAMSVDMFGILFGGVDGILPIFAALLGVGATGLGFLRAAPAAGALVCSIYLANHQPFRRMGTAFLASLAAFGLCMIAFASSTNFWISLAILTISGAVDAIGMVIRPSIYQALTPYHLRGRVASINSIFIRSSNEIGAFESGLAARIMGLVPSVVFGGCMTLVCVGVTVWKAPELRRFSQ